MTSSLQKQAGGVLVFGGTGSIGKLITLGLLRQGRPVCAFSRGRSSISEDEYWNPAIPKGTSLHQPRLDVTQEAGLARIATSLPFVPTGIVYAVGNCPPGGFDDAVKTPLHELDTQVLKNTVALHLLGLHNVIRHFTPRLPPGSGVVVIGSAINRLTDESCPPWLHAGDYATANKAKELYLEWLRRDFRTAGRNILLHLIRPGAVDTPFHQGSAHPSPPLVPLERVVNEVITALNSETPIDMELLSEPPK